MINDTTISVHMIIDNKIMEHIKKNAIANDKFRWFGGKYDYQYYSWKGVALKSYKMAIPFNPIAELELMQCLRL